MVVNKEKQTIIMELKNVTEKIVVIDDIKYQVNPAEIKSEEIAFDANLAALIALVLVLFIGFITFFVVMCCLKYWFLSSTNRPMKLQESPRPMKPGSMVDETLAGGTDNP